MPAKDEKDFMHVRLRKKAADRLRKITKRTRRGLTEEANIAVEVYTPTVFRDNGK